jgi:CheY-like chemotaxis protein
MERKLNCVLLIDDDEPTNFLNQIIIESSGCAGQVRAMQSGEEALHYLMHTCHADQTFPRPDLIFLDINMPAMNGWEFLEKYRRLNGECKSKIVVVMLTTSLFSEDRLRVKEIPEISTFENKPLTEEKLEGILKKFFEDGNETLQRKIG